MKKYLILSMMMIFSSLAFSQNALGIMDLYQGDNSSDLNLLYSNSYNGSGLDVLSLEYGIARKNRMSVRATRVLDSDANHVLDITGNYNYFLNVQGENDIPLNVYILSSAGLSFWNNANISTGGILSTSLNVSFAVGFNGLGLVPYIGYNTYHIIGLDNWGLDDQSEQFLGYGIEAIYKQYTMTFRTETWDAGNAYVVGAGLRF
jgi:hypothetical protein